MAELTMNVRIEPEDIAIRFLDALEYQGKTIREWVNCLSNPKTNADRIRAMSNEELAVWIYNAQLSACFPGMWGEGIWLDWLKSPVEVEE